MLQPALALRRQLLDEQAGALLVIRLLPLRPVHCGPSGLRAPERTRATRDHLIFRVI
jgi:hypothetical protein